MGPLLLRLHHRERHPDSVPGITNNLVRRVWEHKTKQTGGFTSHFHICRLVYYETFDDVRKAIHREKQIKRWRREKKIWLIERVNRNWKDLSDGW